MKWKKICEKREADTVDLKNLLMQNQAFGAKLI